MSAFEHDNEAAHVLVIVADGPYVCATFKSPGGVETSGWLPRAALQTLTVVARASPEEVRPLKSPRRRMLT